MRIGIHPALKRQDGGIYQYTVTMLHALRDWTVGALAGYERCRDEFVIFAHDPGHEALRLLAGPAWTIRTFRPPWAPQGRPEGGRPLDPTRPRRQDDMRRWLLQCGVELMIYPSPHRLSFEAGVPFIMAIHDVQHRLQPEFPEVSADGEALRREYLFRNAVRRATLLLADSDVGREDILNCYGECGVTPERICVLPFLPACPTDAARAELHRQRAARRHGLPPRYLFYPAQFWPHKNHVRIVEALGILKRSCGYDVPMVLTGSTTDPIHERTFAELQSLAEHWGVSSQVHAVGNVSDEEVAGLYAGAVALVMPTFFGPTNIPVLEAWALGCPVLTSDIRGIREQTGDAALRVDPRSAVAIADGIHKLWTDTELRQELATRGRARLARYTRDDYCRRLFDAVTAAKQRVRSAAEGAPSAIQAAGDTQQSPLIPQQVGA
jgi:glycosyltransferase involved in cell wall biosynthesis